VNTLVSFQKSGRTWLMAQVTRYVQEHYGLAAEQVVDSESWPELDARIPAVRVIHDDDAYLKTPDELSDDKSAYVEDNVLLIVRDPRDVIVSLYFELSRRTDFYRQWGVDTTAFPTAETPIGDFLRRRRGSFETLLRYYRIWDRAGRDLERFLCIRYEELHAAPQQSLVRVLDHWGLPVDAADVATAVEACRFERMRTIESAGKAPTLSLRPADPNDPESFKTRRGKVGGYRDYLCDDDIAYMAQLCDDLPPLVAAYRGAG
jgi:hypothetical protein